jgi:hypothetical protein
VTWWKRAYNALYKLADSPLIFTDCPKCGFPHTDEGEWAGRPHRTHLCARCGAKWVPDNRKTVAI